VLKSPGLAPHDARIAPLLPRRAAQGLAVQGELDLFARALADLKAPTASHGYARGEGAGHHRHQRQDHDHRADRASWWNARPQRGHGRQHRPDHARHAGRRATGRALPIDEQLRARALPQVWVLELSSFQLDGVNGFEPTPPRCSTSRRTTSTGTAHGAYAAAKARVFGSRRMVINRDDPLVRGHGAGAGGPGDGQRQAR
jgi:UDP-N-acetylmuramoylalanine--D-glutamate ligase